jgi:hypothetical protein
MLSLGPIGFAAPWLLLALPALPVLWWLLRVTPPAPKRQIFPATRILRDLRPLEATPARTPWWLLLLRLLVAGLIILGLARPIWQPTAGTGQSGPLLLVLDDGWASAPDWARRMTHAQRILEAAMREARPVALLTTSPQEGEADPLTFLPAEEAAARLAVVRPKPWAPDRAAALSALNALRAGNPSGFESLFLTDGLEHGANEDAGPFLATLAAAGPLTLLRAPAWRAAGMAQALRGWNLPCRRAPVAQRLRCNCQAKSVTRSCGWNWNRKPARRAFSCWMKASAAARWASAQPRIPGRMRP